MRVHYLCLLFVISRAAASAVATASYQIDFSYYHTTQKINEELKNLSQTCKGFKLSLANSLPEINLLEIASTADDRSNVKKALLIFGEHPREMISPETGLQLARSLCMLQDEKVADIRKRYDIQMVVNCNPRGRELVESGDYCRRENERKVDLNRNWDSHWKYNVDDQQQTSSGKSPFSEVETQTLKRIAETFKPNVFISVHSGTLGLYTPYAYSDDKASRNEKEMLSIVNQINDAYCGQCGVGAAGKEVGYTSAGTCLDYVYETLKADYAFAYEIYYGSVNLRQTFSQLSANKMLRGKSTKSRKTGQIVLGQKEEGAAFIVQIELTTPEDVCFNQFNPENQLDYQFTVDNWTQALLETLALVPKESAEKSSPF